MSLLSLPLLALLGALGLLAGLLAGLLGIGGGIILVPLFLTVFPLAGFAPEIVVHAALATSLAIIIPTALSSVYGHRRHGNVHWHQVLWLAIGGALGAVAGATLAAWLPGGLLKILFGLMQMLVAARLYRSTQLPTLPRETRVAPRGLLAVGLAGGAFSAFFGVGGGVVAVPLMVIGLRLPVHLAVGNSSALIVISSLTATVSYVLHGQGLGSLPPYSFGYVNLLVFAIVSPFTIVAARLGSRLAGRLPHDKLLKLFAALLILVGLRIILQAIW